MKGSYKEFYEELNSNLKNIKNLKEFLLLKNELIKKYQLKQTPSYIQILTNINNSLFKKLEFLQTKPTRTISGVAPIAIMTRPYGCPHGKCIYCPGGIKSYFGNVPQSYTGHEPAAMRAKRNFYDPYLQVFNRLEQYALLNQNFNKVELIVMGGTFLSTPETYQKDFVTYSFKAMNDFSKMFIKNSNFNFEKFKKFFELPADVHDKYKTKRLQNKILKLKQDSNLKKEHIKNESSYVRCVTLALETRPDVCSISHINNALSYGSTRMELGVQSLQDKILKKANRGHNVRDIINATQLLKDSFFKTGYHIMPGLPGSTKASDIGTFKELFSNPDFKPDALKIYPCMVMPGTKLYEHYKKKRFRPLTAEKAAEIIAESKRYIPKYCRIMRIQRDIPSKLVAAGVDATNLRQHIHELLKQKGIKCNCIRCHEPKDQQVSFGDVKFLKTEYLASGGTEIFLSAEDVKNNFLLGFLRLRIPCRPFRREITANSAGIRELHVYGTPVPLGKKSSKIQHRGYGHILIEESEKIAKEQFGIKKLLVISGIGVKPYFCSLGYKKDSVYMSKKL